MNIAITGLTETPFSQALLLARAIAEEDIFATRNGGRARVVHVNCGIGEDHPVVALVSHPELGGKRCLTFTATGALIDGAESPFDFVAFLGTRQPLEKRTGVVLCPAQAGQAAGGGPEWA